jgi:hypothetical protein
MEQTISSIHISTTAITAIIHYSPCCCSGSWGWHKSIPIPYSRSTTPWIHPTIVVQLHWQSEKRNQHQTSIAQGLLSGKTNKWPEPDEQEGKRSLGNFDIK